MALLLLNAPPVGPGEAGGDHRGPDPAPAGDGDHLQAQLLVPKPPTSFSPSPHSSPPAAPSAPSPRSTCVKLGFNPFRAAGCSHPQRAQQTRDQPLGHRTQNSFWSLPPSSPSAGTAVNIFMQRNKEELDSMSLTGSNLGYFSESTIEIYALSPQQQTTRLPCAFRAPPASLFRPPLASPAIISPPR